MPSKKQTAKSTKGSKLDPLVDNPTCLRPIPPSLRKILRDDKAGLTGDSWVDMITLINHLQIYDDPKANTNDNPTTDMPRLYKLPTLFKALALVLSAVVKV